MKLGGQGKGHLGEVEGGKENDKNIKPNTTGKKSVK